MKSKSEKTLDKIRNLLENGGEERLGQIQMLAAVNSAINSGEPLVVEAGTGTGKSLAYLIPVALSTKKTIIATATKALQDQLINKDVPLVQENISTPLRVAVLKGRSNYICFQKLTEILNIVPSADIDTSMSFKDAIQDEVASLERLLKTRQSNRQEKLEMECDVEDSKNVGLGESFDSKEFQQVFEWLRKTESGDKAELLVEPRPYLWQRLSSSSEECPGAKKCSSGKSCFAEKAKEIAREANVVVVNMHLYGSHIKSNGQVLPEHEIIVLDEAHEAEDIFIRSLGTELSPSRILYLSRLMSSGSLSGGISPDRSTEYIDSLDDISKSLGRLLIEYSGKRIKLPIPTHLDVTLNRLITVTSKIINDLGRSSLENNHEEINNDESILTINEDGYEQSTLRLKRLLETIKADTSLILKSSGDYVIFVEKKGSNNVLVAVPIFIGSILEEKVWSNSTPILTSATMPDNISTNLGIPVKESNIITIESSFPYERNGLIYCPQELNGTNEELGQAVEKYEIISKLISAAGGRTLILCTSWKSLDQIYEYFKDKIGFRLLRQNDFSKGQLIKEFSEDENSCLVATQSFWQGIDIPGRTLSLVIIDKLPFPRPTDPLLEAKREQLGAQAFMQVDIPRATTLLAQAVGRLIRSEEDKGVVAILDSRLVNSRYGSAIIKKLPSMRKTTSIDEAIEFLDVVVKRQSV